MPSEEFWFDRKATTGNSQMHLAYEYAKSFVAMVEQTQLNWDDALMLSAMKKLKDQLPTS